MDFKQAEKKFKQLKDQFESGVLTETEFKAQLDDMMIRDEQGSWWMIGYNTELWYRHDNTDWVQTDLPYIPSQKLTLFPNWVAILWITLGWAIGGAIGGTVAWTLGGAVGGLAIAITLRSEHVLSNWKNMLWITLAWTIGGAISWVIGWAISGGLIDWAIGGLLGWAIGGLVTAITLRSEHVLSDWKSILWITLAWAIGGAIGWVIGGAISGDFNDAISWAIGWAIGGTIGGFIIIWQIREEKK